MAGARNGPTTGIALIEDHAAAIAFHPSIAINLMPSAILSAIVFSVAQVSMATLDAVPAIVAPVFACSLAMWVVATFYIWPIAKFMAVLMIERKA